MSDCLFCKIIDREIPAKFVYEDDDLIVLPDLHPIKPVHLLIIPKTHIADFAEISDQKIMDKVRVVIQKMVKEKKLEGKGYRIVLNGGGAQVINHLHIHLMGPISKTADF